MILLFALLFALLISPTILGQDTLTLFSPNSISQCEQVTFTWSGGTPPYSVAAIRASLNAATAAPTLVYPTTTANTGNTGGPDGAGQVDPRFVVWKTFDTSLTWTVTSQVGTSVAIVLLDAIGTSVSSSTTALDNLVWNTLAGNAQAPGAQLKLYTVANGGSYDCLIDNTTTSTIVLPLTSNTVLSDTVTDTWTDPARTTSYTPSSSSPSPSGTSQPIGPTTSYTPSSSPSGTSQPIGPTTSSAKSTNTVLIGGVVGGVVGVLVIAGLIGALLICRRRRRNRSRNTQPNDEDDSIFVIDPDVPSPLPYPRAPPVNEPLLKSAQAGYGDNIVSVPFATTGTSNANANRPLGIRSYSTTDSRTDSRSSASSSAPLMRQTKAALGAGTRDSSSRSGFSRNDSEMASDMTSPDTIIEFAQDGGSVAQRHVVMPPLYDPTWGERR